MAMIAFAFAAPMLSVVGRDSRTLCLFGPSRSGKTSATLVAASVIGIGKAADLPTWNVTDARLEEHLTLFNDTLFPIDDLGIIAGKPREAYQRVHDLAYRLHQGWARGRHSSFAAASPIRQQWRAIGLTSFELSVRELAERAGCQRQAGEAVRLIDVPVVSESDELFDRSRNPLTRKGSAKLLKEIIAAVADNHGSAFRKYLHAMIGHKDLKTFIERKINEFAEHVALPDDSNIARDVAETFGLAYAAGTFAIESKILPWTSLSLRQALAKVYRSARELLPDDSIALRSGLTSLKALLRAVRHDSVRRKQTDFKKARGICQPKKLARRYLIKVKAFNGLFRTKHERDLVVAWLIENRRTRPSMQRRGNSFLSPQVQFVWPDGRRRRSLEILWPRKRRTNRGRLSRR